MPWIIKLILFVSLMLLAEFYFFRKVFHSIKLLFPNSPILKFKILRIAVLLIINFVPIAYLFTWILELLGGPEIDLPEKSIFFDTTFYYPFWVFIIIVLQSVVLFLLVDLFQLILLPFKKIDKLKLKRVSAKIIIGIAVIITIYAPIRIWYDMTQVSVRITTYESGAVTKDLNNLRIGLISDIQADWYNSNKRILNYINHLNQTNPDIVFITGDLITHDKVSIPVAAKLVGKIKSKYGVYACVGDHDNWAYNRDIMKSRREVIKHLSQFGVQMIDNNNLIMKIGNSTIGITFITDTYSDRINDKELNFLTSNLDSVGLKILVTHQPNGRMKKAAVKEKYNIMVAGHTHGGQITILFPFINLTPTLLETRYVKGDFWFNNLLMVVNRGLGMSLAPIRYNSTPEVTLIILKSK